MKSLLVASLLVLSTVAAQADLLKFNQGDLSLGETNLNKSAVVLDAKGAPTETTVELLGAGIRNKIILISIPVYVAQLFSDNKAGYVRSGDLALESLTSASSTVVLKITMLRDVSASKLADSFAEALETNGLSVDGGELADVLALVGNAADGDAGKDIVLMMKKNADLTVTLSMQDTTNQIQTYTGSESLMKDIMSIWLGESADKGLEKLKSALLQKVY